MNKKQYCAVLISINLILAPSYVYALPTGETVVHGNVKFNITQNTMKINASNKAIINYNSFNIQKNELVKFIQPSANAVVLNRVIMANPSYILGKLSANGRVFLINPAGIIFGAQAQINTASFLASTLNISNEDFLKGNYKFTQLKNMPKSFIIQNSTIKISDNGFVVLAAPFIKNGGVILAKTGNVHIGAVDNFYLNFDGQNLIMFAYKPSKSKVKDNYIVLTQEAKNKIIENILNTNNKSSNLKIVKENGIIKLVNGSGTAIIDGKISTDATQNHKAGNINIQAQNYIYLAHSATLSSNGINKSDGGQISIFSQKDAYLDGATLLAKGGDNGGNGGFIEFSAKQNVFLNGANIDTSAKNGINGIFLIDPKDLTISDNLTQQKTNILEEATNSITLNKGITLSTKGNFDISLYAPNITLQENSNILSGNDITLSTIPGKDGEAGESSSINIANGVTLEAINDLNILATSTASKVFDSDNDNDDKSLTDVAIKIAKKTGNFLLNMRKTPAAYGNAQATSTITIGDSSLTASNIKIASTASANSKISANFYVVAIAYGKASSKANINLNGTKLEANKNITITTNANSTNSVKTAATNRVKNGKTKTPGENIAVAVSDTDTEANNIIDSKTQIIAGGNVNISSTGTKDITTSAKGKSSTNGDLGTAVAISNSNSNIKTEVGGSISANNVNINSNTVVENLKTSSSVKVGGVSMIKKVINMVKKTKTSDIKNSLEKSVEAQQAATDINKKSSVNKLALAASVSISNHNNTNKATIANNANIKAIDNININSNITYLQSTKNGISTTAKATIKSSDDNEKQNSLGGALDITNITNNNNANIGNQATINSNYGNINVKANTILSYNINWQNLYSLDLDKLKNQNMLNVLKNLAIELKDSTEDLLSRVTSEAISNAKGSKNSMAGTFNDFRMTNNTSATIDEGAQINQNKNNTNYQKVNVFALNDIDNINIAGGISNAGDDASIGGSYLNAKYINNITASINKNANVKASALKVQAIQKTHTIDISTAGGKSNYGISGSFSGITTNDNVKSYIDGANIYTKDGLNTKYNPSEDNTNLMVNAQNEADVFNGSGGVAKGSSIGAGVSVTLNNINRDTESYITNSEVSTGDNYINEVSSENKGSVNAYSLAASMTSSTSSSTDSVQSSKAGNFGIGISGDSAINNLNDKSLSYIDKTYIPNNKINDLILNSEDSTALLGLGGAAAISTNSGAGLAGSYISNTVSKDTESYITNSTMYLNKLNIISKNISPVAAYSISGSVGSKSKLNLAGSVAINTLNNKNYTYINNSNLNLQYNLLLNSNDDTPISTDAGGAAVSGTVGVGASFAKTSINNDIKSYIDSSGITTPDNISITAQQNDTINKAIAATLGGSLEGVAAAVSIIKNDITSTIESYIDASTASTDIFGANISVNAKNNTNIQSLAGAVAVSAGGSVGGSYITNEIKNTIKSYIQKSHITTGMTLAVEAVSNRILKNIAVGGAGGEFIGATGSVILNNITDTLESYIQNSIISTSSIAANAIEQNNISDYAGGMSGSSILGVSGSTNTDNIANTITSYIDTSRIDTNGVTYNINIPDITKNDYTKTRQFSGINVLSLANENITPYSANGAFSTDGLALTGSLNNVDISDNLQSTITNSNINQHSTPVPVQNVEVDSVFNNNLNINAGAASLSGGAGMGGSVNNIQIKNTTNSYINNSAINTTGKISANTQGISNIISKTISGVASIYASLGSSVLLIDIADINNAYINNSITSSNEATVSSTDEALLGYDQNTKQNPLLTGVMSGGLAGVGFSVIMNTIKNSSIAYITNSIVNALSNISVNAQNKSYILSKSGSGAIGLSSAAGTINVNTINSTTKAYTQNAELKSNAKKINNTVSISATDSTDINDNLGMKSVSLAGYGGSLDFTNIINHTTANIGQNTQVDAKNLNILSKSEKNFDSYTTSFGGGSIAGSAIILTMGGELENLAKKAYDDTTKILTNIKKTLFGSAASKINPFATVDKSYTYASIKKNSLIKLNDTLQINATTKYNHIYLTSGSKDLGLITSIGGSAALLYNGVDNGVFINTQNPIIANNINMNAKYDMGDVVVKSYNGGIGAEAALGADVTYTTNNFSNTININKNAQLEANKNISIDANTNENIITKSIGAQGSFGLSAGLSSADISSNGNTQTNIGDNSLLYAKNSITNSVTYNSSLQAYSLAAAGGIASGDGSVATINNNSHTNLLIGTANKIESVNSILFNNTVTNNIQADAEGYNLAGLTVGVSYADAKFTPNIYTNIGTKSKILTKNFTLNNYLNMDNANNPILNNGVFTKATSSVGSIIGIDGSIAKSTFNPTLTTNIQNDTLINSAGDDKTQGSITINTKSFSQSNAIADGQSISSLTKGYNNAYATNHTNVNTNIYTGTTIAAHSVNIQNYDKANINIRAYGGVGGILGANKTQANGSMDNNNFINIFGANISSDKDGILNILAYNDAYANIFAKSSSNGLINNNEVDSRLNGNNRHKNHLNVINSVINIQNSNIIGDTVNIKEKVNGVHTSIESDSIINAAGGVASSNVYLYPTIFTKVNLENNHIYGQKHLDINSIFNTNDASFKTKAFSTISKSLIGILNASIDNNPQIYSIVSLDKNTKIGSKGIKYTYAVSPSQTTNNYIKNIDIKNHSVLFKITEVIKKTWDKIKGLFKNKAKTKEYKLSKTNPNKQGSFYTTAQLHNRQTQENYSTTLSTNINKKLDISDLSTNFKTNPQLQKIVNDNDKKIDKAVQTNKRTPVYANKADISKPKHFNITQIQTNLSTFFTILSNLSYAKAMLLYRIDVPKFKIVDNKLIKLPQSLNFDYSTVDTINNEIKNLQTIINSGDKIITNNIKEIKKGDSQALINALNSMKTMQTITTLLEKSIEVSTLFKKDVAHQLNLYKSANIKVPETEQTQAKHINTTATNISNSANNMYTIINSDAKILENAQKIANTQIAAEAEAIAEAEAKAKAAAIAAAAAIPKIVIHPVKIIIPSAPQIIQQLTPSAIYMIKKFITTNTIIQTYPTITALIKKALLQTSHIKVESISKQIVKSANIHTPNSIIQNISIIEKPVNTNINIFTNSSKHKKTTTQ